MTQAQPTTASRPMRVDAVVIGAGLAGLYAHYKLRGLGLSLFGFDAADDVGGTWYWNRYPGARCDVESLDYSYSFSEELLDEWRWSERFATQSEILAYANHVADRFDLRRDIAFATRVAGARYDANTKRWTVTTDRGDSVECQFLVAAVGSLSLPKAPDFPGLDDFAGRWVQTGNWPHQPVDFTGKRVAVIGTGSSGIQCIPLIAQQAAQLTVFQRTPNFSVPAHNGPARAEHEAKVLADYPAYKRTLLATRGGQIAPLSTQQSALDVSAEERQARFEQAWQFGTFALQAVFRDITVHPESNAHAADFVRGKILGIVRDPQTAERLTPRGFPLGTKRLCLDTDYYATFNRDNVELVDLRATPLERITRDGVQTSAREYPVDLIVFATGFDAMTGPLLALNIVGESGQTLHAAWEHGPLSYLGLMVAGFPNLFTVNGPSSPSVLTNMIVSIEHHIELIAECIGYMRERGLAAVAADADAQTEWAEEVRQVANRTLYPQASSWYMGANVPGKPRVFMAYVGGFDRYVARCAEIVADGYRGFRFVES